MNAAFDYIEINDQLFRVEFNMEAVANFLDEEKISFNELSDFTELKTKQLVNLCFHGLVAGAHADGVEFPFSFSEFSSAVYLPLITDMMLIYAFHVNGKKDLEVKKKIHRPKKKRKKLKLSGLLFWKSRTATSN